MALEAGDKCLRIPTRAGPVAIPYTAPEEGDQCVRIPTGNGGYIAQKYTAPEEGDPYVRVPVVGGGTVALAVNAFTTAPWENRSYHALTRLSGNRIIFTGGVLSGLFNDVWISTTKGRSWTQQTAAAEWGPRYWHSMGALSDNTLVLVGGIGRLAGADVWTSSDLGKTWSELSSMPVACYAAPLVVLPDDTILVFTARGSYKSTNGGLSWALYSENLFSGQVVVLSDGSIVVAGWEIVGWVNTFGVFRSTDAGMTWTRQGDVPVPVGVYRDRFGFVRLSDDSMLIMGGSDGEFARYNDVWISTDLGVTWTQQTASALWTPDYAFGAVALTDDTILIIGGPGLGGKVFRSTDRGVNWTQIG